VLSWRFCAEVGPFYELWKNVAAKMQAVLPTFERPLLLVSSKKLYVDEERLSEMLEVSWHLNNTKSLKMCMLHTYETPGTLRTSKWYCGPETGSILPRDSFVCDPFYREEGIKTDVNN
jgi:hypothetical protein